MAAKKASAKKASAKKETTVSTEPAPVKKEVVKRAKKTIDTSEEGFIEGHRRMQSEAWEEMKPRD